VVGRLGYGGLYGSIGFFQQGEGGGGVFSLVLSVD
jgi:hypothetical protein